MKKLLLICFLVASQAMMAQDFFEQWATYESWCKEMVPDTITIQGEVKERLVEVLGTNGCVLRYQSLPDGDTVWDKPICLPFKDDYHQPYGRWSDYIISDTLYYRGHYTGNPWLYSSKNDCQVKVVETKHVCWIKRENPSFEGFIKWGTKK